MTEATICFLLRVCFINAIMKILIARMPVMPRETEGTIFQSYVATVILPFDISSVTADRTKISEKPIVKSTDASLLNWSFVMFRIKFDFSVVPNMVLCVLAI